MKQRRFTQGQSIAVLKGGIPGVEFERVPNETDTGTLARQSEEKADGNKTGQVQ